MNDRTGNYDTRTTPMSTPPSATDEQVQKDLIRLQGQHYTTLGQEKFSDPTQPAYPIRVEAVGTFRGVTIRDYMAAKAMAALIAAEPNRSWEELARDAYIHADAMLKERTLERART